MEEASRAAFALPAFAESSEQNPDASFNVVVPGAVEHTSAVDMSQPTAEDGAHAQSNALALSYVSRNEEFVVVDLDSTLQQSHQHYEYLPEPGLTELRTTDAATQCDGDTESFGKALKDRDRRIEELERRICVQEAEIARIEQEMVTCRKECAEQVSSMRQYVDDKTSEARSGERENYEATDVKHSWPLHLSQLGGSVQRGGPDVASFYRVKTAHSGAQRVSAPMPSYSTVGCEEGASVEIRQEVAAYRQECEHQILGLRQRLEASCFELRVQCSACVTALERRLRETMSAEHETMRSCVKEMTLLRDYVTSMTDVIETIVSLYEPKSDSTRTAPDSGEVSKSDSAK